ncbi:hypothetical protein HMI54_006392 [Coelomomyces lativittatus]|nr:hypothetical protein HMI54_006392 [Coelomomyces lativittatus]
MATPHLGVYSRAPFLAESILFRSGSQCTLYDSDYGPPLLWILSDPSLCFFKGLQLFQRHLIVANSVGDRTVPFLSASLRLEDPYLTGLPAPVVDDGRPMVVVKPSGIPHTKSTTTKVTDTMKFTAFYAVFIPLVVTAWCFIAPLGYVQARQAKSRYLQLSEPEQTILTHMRALKAHSNEWKSWNAQEIRHRIVQVFDEQLKLERIDAHLGEYAHTHALIVVRNPGRHAYGAPVVEYVVQQFKM